MRMQQFFDTKLKGTPAPDWMVRGIPYRVKGRDQLGAVTQPRPRTRSRENDKGPAHVCRPFVIAAHNQSAAYWQRFPLQVIGFDVDAEPPDPVAVSVTV